MAAVTNYHEFHGLKKQTFSLFEFWRSDIQKSVSLGQNQGGSRGEFVCLPFPASRAAFLAFLGSWLLLKQACDILVIKIKTGGVNEGQK